MEIINIFDIILIIIALIFLFLKKHLLSYFNEKGKNLATKEDIAQITEKIESVKTNYTTSLEKFKLELTKDLFKHNIQFEKEYAIYIEIWAKLIEVRNATLKLRPIWDTIPNDITEEQFKNEKLNNFKNSFSKFQETYEKNRPFYSEFIYKELYQLNILIHNEAIEFDYGKKEDIGYWQKAKENSEKIINQINIICSKIRERVV